MKTRITWFWAALFSLCSFLAIAQKNNNPNKESEYTIEIEYTPVENQGLSEKSAMNLSSFHCRFSEYDNTVLLNWQASNIEGEFIIEYSTDNVSFLEIGSMKIAQFNNLFSFKTDYYQTGRNYYRIKQLYNNNFTFSEIKAIEIIGSELSHFLELIDENDKKRLQLRVQEKQFVSIQLLDSQGNIKKDLFGQVMEENEIIFRTFPKYEFPSGNYFLVIKGDKFNQILSIRLPN